MVEFELFIQGIDPVVKRMAKRGGKKKILWGFGFWQATLLIMELQKIQNYRLSELNKNRQKWKNDKCYFLNNNHNTTETQPNLYFSLNYVRHFILNHFILQFKSFNSVVLIQI